MLARQDSIFERWFHLREHGTSVRTEVVAGITTFMTMAYIIVVNPSIVGLTGMPVEGVVIATAVSAAFATLLMSFLANYPFALAPGMGLNAYFTFTVVLGMGVPWQTALGAVFISGVLFVILTVSRIRGAVIDAVPDSLKSAIGAGIGLFIAFIGLQNAQIIVPDEATVVALGNFANPETLVAGIGILLTGGLMALGVKGAILIGIILTALVGMGFGIMEVPTAIVSLPNFSAWGEIFGQLDIGGALNLGLFTIVFAFLFVDFFDTMGTLIGVAKQGNFLDAKGRLPRADRALISDAVGTMAGAVGGTPTVTAYIESASGVAAGGRTGLTGLVVAAGFLLSLFFSPLVIAFADNVAITAPALFAVGALMLRQVSGIDWEDFSEALPAFTAIIMMPLAYSIAEGIALAFIAFPLVKLISGKGRTVHPVMWILALLFIVRYAYL